ncbi:MAG: hypothetical protein IJW19_05140 [Clostridia bacterium]|nr:hypothetical protein [Clostridia bacterium]
MKRYKIIGTGKRLNEEIMAILDENGRIHKVASAYFDYKKNVYRLYPVNYGTYSTISTKISVHLNDVQLR